MALYTGRLLMRGGNESDFDPDKMMPREWAVSTDKKIVRICIAPGVCIRMATYDAFEEDMAKIENILKECQSIQEVVVRINTEVSQNADAVAEYTAQAKQYRDEAKRFRDEAFATTPDGYAEVVETVAKNTVKIDTVIEKADLGIKETATGEEIHLTDSAEGKAVEFALYGKAKQNTTSGKNLLDTRELVAQTIGGINFTPTYDSNGLLQCINLNGDANSEIYYNIKNPFSLPIGKYFVNGERFYVQYKETWYGNGTTFEILDSTSISAFIYVKNGASYNDFKIYPMISLDGGEYEPYTNGASPNPQYPQPIEVSGESGSVAVKSCGKNLLKNIATTKTTNGGTITVNDDKSFTINGTFTTKTYFPIDYVSTVEDSVTDATKLVGKTLIASISETIHKGIYQSIGYFKKDGTYKALMAVETNKEVVYPTDAFKCRNFVAIDVGTYNNITVYPMIRVATDIDDTYEPYKETLSTIPTENGLAGIKVSSGGNYTDQNGQKWICDEIVKYADGSGKHIQRVGKFVSNGSEEYIQSSRTNENRLCVYTGNATIASGVKSVICNRFINGDYILEDTLNIVNSNSSNINFGVSKNIASTIEEFKTWLSNNPTTVYVELATPINTPLTAEEIAEIEKLHTFYPVTNISNDFDCGMKVKYNADSKNYIDNKISLLTTAMVNNI